MPPDKHPGFRKAILRYDMKTDKWTETGEVPAAQATVPLVRWRDRWVMISGEIRPGIRTPEFWSVQINRNR